MQLPIWINIMLTAERYSHQSTQRSTLLHGYLCNVAFLTELQGLVCLELPRGSQTLYCEYDLHLMLYH